MQLVELHSRFPWHGVVNPGNIFLDESGSAHLGSTADPARMDIDDIGAIEDLVDCLAPEMAISSATADARADIYSLGCTLYYLLAGRTPFPEGSISERLLKHHTACPDSLSRLRPDIPPPLISICDKMMAKKADDRYQKTIDVVEALTAWRNSSR